MIVLGKSRGNAGQLAAYLLRQGDNDRPPEIIEVSGYGSSLKTTLECMDEAGRDSRGEKTLYHAQINPEPGHPVNWIQAADILAEEMGFEGQPRVLVLHEKKGRQHLHVVFQRYDVERGTLIHDGHNYRKHTKAARRMEKEFGHQATPESRSRKTKPTAEKKNGERWFKAWAEAKATIRQAWEKNCSDGVDFLKCLLENGFVLAKGDRRAFAVIDRHGEEFNPLRALDGVKTAEFKRAVGKEVYEGLPTVAEVREQQAKRREEAATQVQAERKVSLLCLGYPRRRVRRKPESRKSLQLRRVRKRRTYKGIAQNTVKKMVPISIKTASLRYMTNCR